MKKHIIIAAVPIAIGIALLTSSFKLMMDCGSFEQFTEGATWTMTNYNSKGKEESHTDCKVNKLTAGVGSTSADIAASFFDAKGKENGTSEYTITCKGGNYTMDMRNFVTPEMKKGAGKDMEIKMDGDMLEYPATMKAGDSLPNGTMKVTMINNGQTFMTTTVYIKNRKCEAVESKTTSAGTWECFKISYTVETAMTNMMGMNFPVKPRTTTEWFSFKVGSVRTESYKEGELESYSELTKFKKP